MTNGVAVTHPQIGQAASGRLSAANTPRLKSLVISTLFPNSAQPRHGIFIEHRLRNMNESGRIAMEVLAPVPWFPFTNQRFGSYAAFARAPRAALRHGLEIRHPRYLAIPKVGMTLAPFLLAAALVRPIGDLIRAGRDFEVIDAFYFYPDGVAAAMLGRYFRKPVVIHALGTDINLIPQRLLPRQMIRWAAQSAAGISAVCQALKDRLVELGVGEDKIRVILHGVDLELFRPPNDREADRGRLRLARPTLISIGHLIERKGHHIIIEAMTELPEFELLIAGDGEMEQTLRQLAQRHRVAERVRFLGHVDQRELKTYLGAADALVLASSREGIANVLLEAMACGTPVVTTKVWGAPEVVTEPEAGVLVSERSPGAVALAVRRLFAAYPDRAATRRFVESFTWARTTREHLAMLEEVLGLSGRIPQTVAERSL
jgi:glycosyltransferase involved in cell wall biosynthesis